MIVFGSIFLSISNLSIDFAGETLSVVRTLKNWLNLVCHWNWNFSALSLILVVATHLEIGHIECLIFKWVAATSLKWYGTVAVAPAVVVGQHGPFIGCAVTVNGCFTFQSIVIIDNNNLTVEFLAYLCGLFVGLCDQLCPHMCVSMVCYWLRPLMCAV